MRICLNCLSDKTNIKKNGIANWYKHKDGYLCHRCYCKLFNNPKWNPINQPRRIVFKDERISLKEDPRIGICNWCCAVVGINCKQTQIHHLEYHDDDMLKDTVELCARCHTYESWRIRKYHSFDRKS